MLNFFGGRPAVPELTARELKTRLDGGEAFILLDVRDDRERAVSALPGSTHIPVAQVAQRIAEVKALRAAQPAAALVCYCKGGVRSAKAADLLIKDGMENVINLQGGILAWARDCAPGMKVG